MEQMILPGFGEFGGGRDGGNCCAVRTRFWTPAATGVAGHEASTARIKRIMPCLQTLRSSHVLRQTLRTGTSLQLNDALSSGECIERTAYHRCYVG